MEEAVANPTTPPLLRMRLRKDPAQNQHAVGRID
jgi:hypothetical protein